MEKDNDSESSPKSFSCKKRELRTDLAAGKVERQEHHNDWNEHLAERIKHSKYLH
jgi:hypothetical protein